MKKSIIEKLISRIDKLHPQSLQAYLLKLAEQTSWFDTILEAIKEGIIVVDKQGKILYVNKACDEIIGVGKDSLKYNITIDQIIQGIDWGNVLNYDAGEWARLINTELEIHYPSHRFIHIYVVPMHVKDKNEKGAVIIMRDVTSQKKSEQAIIESERIRAITLLASSVAHEIGNPLNALHIHLQLLKRSITQLLSQNSTEISDKKLEVNNSDLLHLLELAEISTNEVMRLDTIIKQFLQAMRPTKPKLESCNVIKVLENTLRLLQKEIEDKKINVEIRKETDIPDIPADSNQLQQAFFNIIKNSLQAMTQGGIIIIGLKITETNLKISFHDTGRGIKHDDLKHIFEPFHSTKSDGTGLGLTIVQRIIHDHGGQIEIASKPETGTIITLTLPLTLHRIKLLKSHL